MVGRVSDADVANAQIGGSAVEDPEIGLDMAVGLTRRSSNVMTGRFTSMSGVARAGPVIKKMLRTLAALISCFATPWL
jgi:hypothetical protein